MQGWCAKQIPKPSVRTFFSWTAIFLTCLCLRYNLPCVASISLWSWTPLLYWIPTLSQMPGTGKLANNRFIGTICFHNNPCKQDAWSFFASWKVKRSYSPQKRYKWKTKRSILERKVKTMFLIWKLYSKMYFSTKSSIMSWVYKWFFPLMIFSCRPWGLLFQGKQPGPRWLCILQPRSNHASENEFRHDWKNTIFCLI